MVSIQQQQQFKPYKLIHPLYPDPQAIQYVKDQGMKYEPFVGSNDERYMAWYDSCMKDIIEGGAAPRKIWHFVSAIYRTRDLDGEKVYYKEYIQAHDENLITHTFDHFVGFFEVQEIDTYYDYAERTSKKRFKGVIERHFNIDYKPEKILEIAQLAQPGKRQNYYLVTNGREKHTHDVFFTPQAFAYMEFDELYEIAKSSVVPDVLRQKAREINASVKLDLIQVKK